MKENLEEKNTKMEKLREERGQLIIFYKLGGDYVGHPKRSREDIETRLKDNQREINKLKRAIDKEREEKKVKALPL